LILDPIVKGIQAGGAKPDVKWGVEVHVSGGGIHSQAEAIRHGLSRALVLSDGALRGGLKTLGFLKRDPRAKERRKFGLKKARKAPQWSKR
jgi:small subunit ribosomal protein S9